MTNAITLRIPDSLYEQAKKSAKDDGISLNQYVQMALADKLARKDGLDMLRGRFAELEDDLKLMMLERDIKINDYLQEEFKRLNRRYTLLEKRTRSFS